MSKILDRFFPYRYRVTTTVSRAGSFVLQMMSDGTSRTVDHKPRIERELEPTLCRTHMGAKMISRPCWSREGDGLWFMSHEIEKL